MHWASKYIRLKYVPGGRGPGEVDCWGLLCLVYQEKYGIALPSLPGISVARAIAKTEALKQEVQANWTEVQVPFEGCGIGLSQKNETFHHVGIFIHSKGGKILHCWNEAGVVVDTVPRLRLKGFRTIRYYRHTLWPL